MSRALVVGGGPAGLMAAGELLAAGHDVAIADAKPSFGRKFLMAGKSGLNLTKSEPIAVFRDTYSGSLAPMIREWVTEFGPEAVQLWARELGQEVFTGSSGRVFPEAMKASPLLRAWLTEFAAAERRTGWRLCGIEAGMARFETPDGPMDFAFDAAVLALGGASWARLGSDGKWAAFLGAKTAPFQPSNCGFVVRWSEHMKPHFGAPVKAVRLKAGGREVRGEFVLSERGVEGSAIYHLSWELREGAALTLDLCPDLTQAQVAARLSRPRGKATRAAHLRKSLKLDPVRLALVQEFGRPLPEGDALAALIKNLPVPIEGPRPLDEAISTAGGVCAEALNGLQLKHLPGVFVAGEMLDWDAPTGGYLITACLATGRAAGQQAAHFLANSLTRT